MDTIKQTVAQNFGGPAHQAVSESQQFALEQVPSLTGKVAVITGGSEGIGYACSHTLLTHDIKKIFILSVSKDVIDGAVDAVKQEMGQEAADKITWLQCDLSDWKAVKATADKIASQTDRIDILINNAARGIMTYQVTDYGVDRHVSILTIVNGAERYGGLTEYAVCSQPCRSRHSDQSSLAHLEEDRIGQQHCPDSQPLVQRPPSGTQGCQV